jgi:CubicO group peptidase (beta-lactamase class C family)
MSFSKLEKFIFDKVAASKLPSVAAAVIKDGETAWSGAFGFRDLEQGIPATPDSLYCIGSVTKSFTALAVLQLVEEGKLKLDDPIDKYLPFDVKPYGEPILIWHFLSHTSGIPALGHAEAVIRATMGDTAKWIPSASYTDLLTFMQDADEWVLTKPGERWFYLNEGYKLVGAIISKVSGMSYEDYITRHILEPLGMNHSAFGKEKAESNPEFATPYIVTQEGKHIPSTYPYNTVNAAGGLISSVNNMLRYVYMFLERGAYDGGQLVSEESLQDMQTPRIPTPRLDGYFGSYDYALGLGITSNFLGHRLIGHSGGIGTATAYMAFIPEMQAGVVVLANGSGYAPALMGQYGLALALDKNPDELPFAKNEKRLEELSGNYETYQGTTSITVKPAGDFLMMVSSSKFGTMTTPLIPESLDGNRKVFYTLAGGSRVEAEFILEGERITLTFERYAYRKVGKLT